MNEHMLMTQEVSKEQLLGVATDFRLTFSVKEEQSAAVNTV
jgi:hypothetical protein